MRTSVFCEFRLEAAHRLTKVPPDHKCSRMHGHSYRVVVTVTGCVGDKGWIVDYAEIADAWQKHVHDVLDHQTLNGVLKDETGADVETTSELLAAWIYAAMQHGLRSAPATVSRVDVWETAAFGATVQAD